MPYDPSNNPYIPGDPYAYDLKWVVKQIKGWKDPADSADRAKASEDAAKASELNSEAWAVGEKDGVPVDPAEPQHDNNSKFWAGEAADSAAEAKDYADHIADPVSGIVTDWLDDHITQPTTPAIDTSLTVAGAAADAEVVGDNLVKINAKLNDAIKNCSDIDHYLYKKDTYINSSLVETPLAGYDTYYIPIDGNKVVTFMWSAPFWGGLAVGYVFRLLDTTDTLVNPAYGDNQIGYYIAINLSISGAVVLESVYKGVYVTVDRTLKDNLIVYVGDKCSILNTDPYKNIVPLDDNNSVITQAYIGSGNILKHFAGSDEFRSIWKAVKQGDVIKISNTLTGPTYSGSFIDSSNARTAISIGVDSFTAPSDGIVNLIFSTIQSRKYELWPVTASKISIQNVVGGGSDQFRGRQGVAFGTSLTYRSLLNYGYLTKLEQESGITFDNQGIGSSKIMSNMLTAIKGYPDYASKEIAILEGFVNDWYQGEPLGQWNDSAETTVCGCVRSALNYMLGQNANLTVFLILDHYGKLNAGVDCRSTAVNANMITQFEYYEEIAKVAESLGIPVIREYAISGISENTPQYLLDNIHCNALGANQSGNAIWYAMKQYPANL